MHKPGPWPGKNRDRMSKQRLIKELMDRCGEGFSTSLGIDLPSLRPEEIFKWFLASLLFGARISETIAVKTYKQFEEAGLLSPSKILEAGWHSLVDVLDKGGYVRYDYKTATKLLEVMGNLNQQYQGDLNRLHLAAKDARDLEQRVCDLGKGVGEVTANIFLREMRGLWEKAETLPSDLVIMAAKNLGLIRNLREAREVMLDELRTAWGTGPVPGKRFADFEAALVRIGKDYCRRKKCQICPVRGYCQR